MDADRAIELSRLAVAVTPVDHPDRARYLSNLAAALIARCTRSGALQAVDVAVDAGREAVRVRLTTPGERLGLATDLANLAIALRKRYELTFALSDLDEAIRHHRSALQAMPADHPLRPMLLSNLCVALMSRFHRGEDSAIVNEMIEAARSALDALPADHAARPRHLANYANTLHLRHAGTKDLNDVEAAVAASQEALQLTPQDHPSRWHYLSSLSLALRDRYTHSQRRRDLNAVIEVGRAAVLASPAGHPGSGRLQYNLALALAARTGRTGSSSDLKETVGLFRDVARTPTAPTELRIRAARRWGDLVGWLKRWMEAVAGYRTALELLPLLAWHGLERADRLSALGGFTGLAGTATAAALMLKDPAQAVQLLEQGRCVLHTQALDAREDLARLAAVDLDLAERMHTVRTELDTVLTPDNAEQDRRAEAC